MKNTFLKIGVSLGLLTILLTKTNTQELLFKLGKMDLRFALLAVGFIVLNYIFSAFRWKKLLIFSGTENIKISYLVRLYFIGSYFNNFMPTSIGGDAYKVLNLGKKIGSKKDAFAAVFMERLSGVVVLVCLSLISLVKLNPGLLPFIVVLLFISGIIFLKSIKILSSKFTLVSEIVESFKKYKSNSQALSNSILLSIFIQGFAILSQYFIFASIGLNPSMLFVFFAIPIITLSTFFVPSLNGIGVQDALYVSFFSQIGVAAESALTVSILYHILRLVVSLVGGILYAFGKD